MTQTQMLAQIRKGWNFYVSTGRADDYSKALVAYEEVHGVYDGQDDCYLCGSPVPFASVCDYCRKPVCAEHRDIIDKVYVCPSSSCEKVIIVDGIAHKVTDCPCCGEEAIDGEECGDCAVMRYGI